MRVIFKEALYTSMEGKSYVELIVPYGVINIELRNHFTNTYGLTAGSEGLGCEFFTKENGSLSGMVLDLKPLQLVNVAPMDVFRLTYERIRSMSVAGILKLKDYPRSPLHPDAIWLANSIWNGHIFLQPSSCSTSEAFS